MNVVKVMGGLGNQIFQWTMGQAMIHNGIEVRYDLSWFHERRNVGETARHFHLDKFLLPEQYPEGSFIPRQMIIVEGQTYEEVLPMVDNCNFHGYWQCPKYFTPITARITDDLQLKESFISSDYKELKHALYMARTTALHIRRGDFLTTRGFTTVPMDFYMQALQMMIKAGDVWIFSDDPGWCEKNFPNHIGRNLTLHVVPTHITEFESWDLLRWAENQVIANSSFSLTAGLFRYGCGLVIYPQEYWPNGRDYREQVPEWWTPLKILVNEAQI